MSTAMKGLVSTAPPEGGFPAAAKADMVALALPATARVGGVLVARGHFSLLAATRAGLGNDPHRLLTIAAVLRAGHLFRASCPFAEHALFPDDLVSSGNSTVGCFAVDIAGLLQLDTPGPWWITASLGPIASQPVPVALT
jgi:hypothetical protein